MKRLRKFALVGALICSIGVGAAACGGSNADVASKNLSTEAEQFKVARKVIFVNTFTNTELFSITGLCSVDTAGAGLNAVAVVCKTGPNSYVKDFLGKADNVTWIVQQLQGVDVSTYHYEVVIKPESVVPSFSRPSNSDQGATGDTGTLKP